MDLNHYIYRISRLTTGEWYIGIRSCKCWPTEDVRYMGSGRLIEAKIKKYGREQFAKTILAIVKSRKEAARIEAALIGSAQVADVMCLNLCEGGDVGPLGSKWSRKSKNKKSFGMLGNTNARGHRHDANSLSKMSAAWKDRVVQKETCNKISSALTGNTNARGHIHSDVQKSKMRASWTPERRAAQARRLAENIRTP